MTQLDAADAIMEVMQNFVNAERKKIWELAQKQNREWRKKAERFIQFYIDSEAKSPLDSLNQVYAKTIFAGVSVRSVLEHAKELLKTTDFVGYEENTQPLSDIQIVFPNGHQHNCSYGTINGKVILCNCGLHDALKKRKVQ